MARRARAAWANQPPPMKKRGRKAAETPEKPKEPELPDTTEGLLEAMGDLCNKVDALIAKETAAGSPIERDFRYLYRQPPEWQPLVDMRVKLTNLLRDKIEDGQTLRSIVCGGLSAELGTVPSFARPGLFVLWVDFMPVVVQWDGFLVPQPGFFLACNVERPFGNSIGQREFDPGIGKEPDVELLCRRELADWTTDVVSDNRGSWKKPKPPRPVFNPQVLGADGRRATANRMSVWEPWLRPILRRGPVNPIPMPKHVKSIQMALA
jgi:hypothetical protein